MQILTLEIIPELNQSCFDIDPLGQCSVIKCLCCSNADYRLSNNENIIKEFSTIASYVKQKEVYQIEIFESIEILDYFTYFQDKNSDYRITRTNDQVILRPSKQDQLREQQRRMLMKKIYGE